MFGFDASVFHLDWNNILINTVFTDPATGTQFGANGNGRRARVTGAEGTFTLRPMRGFTGILNLAWTDAKLRDDTTPAPGILNLTGGLAGDRLPYTPRIQASLSVDYEWALAGNARAYVGGNVRIVGDEPSAFNATYRATFHRRLTIDGYTTLDLRAGVDLGRVSISAYARNFTNSHGLVSAGYPTTIPAVVGGTATPFATVSSIRPRTIGMTLGFAY